MAEGEFGERFSMGDEHSLLHKLTGEWQGVTRTWFEPGKLADESPNRGVIRPLLDGRFVRHEYEGTLCGERMTGTVTFGYDRTTRKYQAAWIDNCHMGTGMMFSEGNGTSRGFAVTGSYPDPGGGPRWAWRTEVHLDDDDHLRILAFNITPVGEEALGVETVYTRVR